MTDFTTILDGRHFLEGPRWHNGRIWVSDFHGHDVVSSDLQGDVRVEVELDDRPSGLGWLPDGRLLVVSMEARKVMRREESGELVVHSDLSEFHNECNDMLVDAQGRAYVSATGFNSNIGESIKTAPLVKVDPDGSASVVADDLHMPNGITRLPDGTLVVAETLGNRLSGFDVRPDGTLSERRDWATFGDLRTSDDLMEVMPGTVVGPDGICADSEGCVWAADALHNRVVRVEAGGKIVQDISTGDRGAYSLTLGGPDGRTLFICSAPDFNYEARAAVREATLLAVTVDVPV
ncbi:MAG: SMP-30/gluconolactonase/LRE family protein [Aeromicrobium sp.]